MGFVITSFVKHIMVPEEYGQLDPLNPALNEGGYVVLWPQTTLLGEFEWNWYVWGQQLGGRLDGAPVLVASSFDADAHRYFILTIDFPLELEEQIEVNGLMALLPVYFESFYYMVGSVRSGVSGSTTDFQGVLRRGADLGEAKFYCSEGLFLVAERGYLTGQTSILLLRVPDAGGQPLVSTDQVLINSLVTVTGVYPALEVFCEALLCDCEDFILVEKVESNLSGDDGWIFE